MLKVRDFHHYYFWCSLVVFGILMRILPHPANVTPILAITLCFKHLKPRYLAGVLLACMLLISDGILFFTHAPLLWGWLFFNYTGWFGIYIYSVLTKRQTFYHLVLWCSGIFWLWTNWGVWLTSNLYALNLSGLITCYIAAIPFLIMSMIGDLLWSLVLKYFLERCLVFSMTPPILVKE